MSARFRFLAVACLLAPVPGRVTAQQSPCLTNADTASKHVQAVTRIVTTGDSSRLVQLGIPYHPPAGVSLVTDSLTCRAMVNAYNALDSSTSRNITSAYVMRVGTTVYAMSVGTLRPAYIFWDTDHRWLVGLAGL